MATVEVKAHLDKSEFSDALAKLSEAISKGESDELKPFVEAQYASLKGASAKQPSMGEVVMLIAKSQMALAVNNPDEALACAKEACDKIEVAIDTRALIGPALKALSAAYLLKDDAGFAKKAASDMLERGKKYALKDVMAAARVMIARSYMARPGAEHVEDAAEEVDKALSHFKQTSPSSKDMALALESAATVYYAQGKVQAGVNAANDAVTLYKDKGFTKDMAKALQVLIQGYALLDDPMAGLRAANSELSFLRRSGNKRAQADVLMTLAESHATLGEPVGALKNAKEALDLYMSIGDKFSEASTLLTIAEMQRAQGEKVQATVTAETAMKLFKDLRSQYGQEQAKDTLSLLLVERGAPEKAPNRGEALRVLRALCKAIEKKNADDLKECDDKLNAMSGLVSEQECQDALQSVVSQDPSVIDFLIDEGWDIKKPKAGQGDGKQLIIDHFNHKMIYLYHIFGGMNFGPQFRHVHGCSTRPGHSKEHVAMCVSTLASNGSNTCQGTDEWERSMMYRPGIQDAFQVLLCPNLPRRELPKPGESLFA